MQTQDRSAERHLISYSGARTRHWRVRREGSDLVIHSGAHPARLRETRKVYADEGEAQFRFVNEVWKKMGAGYLELGDWARAERGDALLHMRVPHQDSSECLDYHHASGRIAAGVRTRKERAPELYLIDIRTGRLTRAWPGEGDGRGCAALYSVHFSPAGERLFFTLERDEIETHALDLESGRAELLGSYPRYEGFNPYFMKPTMDSAGRYLFCVRGAVLLRGPGGEALLRVERPPATSEYAGMALAGNLLALYVASRRLLYGHGDAAHDHTNEVRIWDIAQGQVVQTIAVGDVKLNRIGLSPDGAQLLATHEPVRGPYLYDLASGALQFYMRRRPNRDDAEPQVCFDFAHSPDGALLAIGSYPFRSLVYERPSGAILLDSKDENKRTYRIILAPDSSLLVTGGDSGEVIVRRL